MSDNGHLVNYNTVCCTRGLPLLQLGVAAGLTQLPQLGGGVPRGYLRVLVFDKDSALVDQQVRPLSQAALHGYEELRLQLTPAQDGYVTAYVGNESDVDVFFDDTQVEHRQGLQVQETQYDPVGLELAGLSRETPGLKPLNQYRWNGKEFQADLGLNWTQLDWRMYDPQINHMPVVDPEVENGQESMSPYAFSYDNAVRYNDPDGRCPICPIVIGAVIGAGVDYGFQVASNHFLGGQSWTEAASPSNINFTSIKLSAVAGGLSGGLSALGAGIARSTAIAVGTKAVLHTGIAVSEGGVLAAESIAKQSTDPGGNGQVSAGQVATDVAVGVLTGGLPGARQTNTGPLARAVSRTERVAGQGARVGRVAQAQAARGALRRANVANVVREVGSGLKAEVIENSGQTAAGALQTGAQGATPMPDLGVRPGVMPADNTRVYQRR